MREDTPRTLHASAQAFLEVLQMDEKKNLYTFENKEYRGI